MNIRYCYTAHEKGTGRQDFGFVDAEPLWASKGVGHMDMDAVKGLCIIDRGNLDMEQEGSDRALIGRWEVEITAIVVGL